MPVVAVTAVLLTPDTTVEPGSETMLELKHPASGRKVLLVQSEMDVNVDGSDGDRLLPVDMTSSTFQPFTSY